MQCIMKIFPSPHQQPSSASASSSLILFLFLAVVVTSLFIVPGLPSIGLVSAVAVTNNDLLDNTDVPVRLLRRHRYLQINNYGEADNSNNNATTTTTTDTTSPITSPTTTSPIITTSTSSSLSTTKPPYIAITASTFFSVSIIFAVVAAIFVWINRNNNIVAVGQPFFLYTICFGSLLIGISISFGAGFIEQIPGISHHTLNVICIVEMWFFQLGTQIVYMSLFCKLWRAEKVCQFRKGQRILVKHVLWPFVVLVCFEITIIIVSTIMRPPSWQKIYLDPFSTADANVDNVDNDRQFETCNIQNDPITVITIALSHTLMLVTQSIVIWMAFRTRNINEAIVDTKRVYQLMICQMILFILYMLFSYGVIPIGDLYYLMEIFLPFLYAITSVGFLICPKIYYVWYEKHHTGQLPEGATTLGVGTVKVYGVTNEKSSGTTTTARSTKRSSGTSNIIAIGSTTTTTTMMTPTLTLPTAKDKTATVAPVVTSYTPSEESSRNEEIENDNTILEINYEEGVIPTVDAP